MSISSTFSRILKNMFGDKNHGRSAITIPYGKHSYGPQPEIIGFMPEVTARKIIGSRVGKFCSISQGVKFVFLGKHNYNWVSGYPFYAFYDKWGVEIPLYTKGLLNISKIPPAPIVIENDVWVASNVTIKEGVRICSGAVVAMGSLVTKDIPPYAFVGGNPAKIIRYRFTDEQIQELLKIAWWDWDDKDISALVPLLLSDNVDSFIKAARSHGYKAKTQL